MNMRVAAKLARKRRGLKNTLELKKALRYHYQLLADKGEFKSYTSAELALMGVDTSTWNDGDGLFPPDFYKKEKLFLEGKLKPPEKPKPIPVDPKPEPVDTGKAQSHVEKTLDKIQKTGKAFKEPVKNDGELPPFNFRHWKGEHRNWGKPGAPFELKPGHRWDPFEKKWVKGEPIINEFYWQCEFMNDPRKYYPAVPYGQFHAEILENLQRYMRICILVARDHLKTTMFNVNHMCYYAIERPELAKMGILNIAWSPKLASTTFNRTIEHLEQNEKILDFYGCVIDQNRSKTKEFAYFIYQGTGADYGIRCTSFKSGSIVGAHPILVLIDDVTDKPLSVRMMANFREVMNKTIIPAVGKYGRIIMTGTIKGWTPKNDPYLWIGKNKTWKTLKYPAMNKVPPMSDVFYEMRERQAIDPITMDPVFNPDGSPVIEEFMYVEIENRELYYTKYPKRYSPEDIVRKRIEMFDEDDKVDDDFWSEYMLVAMNPAGKYFNRKRIGHMPPPGFHTARDFREHLRKKHQNVYLWIDPGGEKGHGIAVVVGCKYKGRYYFFEFKVIRAPMAKAAEVIARVIVEWEVDHWGVEGNFSQKGQFADVLNIFLRDYMRDNGWEAYYTRPIVKSSTGDKFQRIQTHISSMIGIEGTDTTIYVNTDCEDFPVFDKQVTGFGLGMPPSKKHEFDLLDDMAQMKIHCFSKHRGAVMAAC